MKKANEVKERAAKLKEEQNQKRERIIDAMSPEEVKNQLQEKKLPIFGTNAERIQRLKKAHGIQEGSTQKQLQRKGSNVLQNIDKIQQNREERRKKAEEVKFIKQVAKVENEAVGRLGDVDFLHMVNDFRAGLNQQISHVSSKDFKICVCVRKRPIFGFEEKRGEIDAISCISNKAMVHDCKLKVDGISKFLQNTEFRFDNTFNETEDTATLYEYSLRPLCEFIAQQRGTVTCFAYGQTGSGKTFTMVDMQAMAIRDLFRLSQSQFIVSFFEIYGGRCYDLFNNRARLNILEDGNQNIVISGITEQEVQNAEEMQQIIEYGNSVRTTHGTVSNQDSSRSHAILRITLVQGGYFAGCMNLVDLAGSERAADTMSDNRQRRLEGAEINKSLLALKECIRALCSGSNTHIPYRGSKLTMVLRDAFVGNKDEKKIVMITCINPGHSSSEHTLNSLRYADRLKEKSGLNNKVQVEMPKQRAAPAQPPQQRMSPKNAQQNRQRGASPKAAQRNASPKAAQRMSPKNAPARPAQQRGAPPQPQKAPARAEPPKPPLQPQNARRGVQDKLDNIPLRGDAPGNSSSSEDEREPDEDDQALRRTINDIRAMHNNAEQEEQLSQEMLAFHEKVETIMEEEEKLLSCHVDAIKEDAKMLTEEGKLISMVQGEGVVDYDIDEYVRKMEKLVRHKIAIYQQLAKRLSNFKQYLNEEEEVSHNITRKKNLY